MRRLCSPRWFSLHGYYPLFHIVLLRSRPTTIADNSIVVDVVFRNVFYIDLRSDFQGLTIEEAPAAEAARLDRRAGLAERCDDNRYFVLISDGQRYYIGATQYRVEENKLGWGETSLDATFTAPDEYEWAADMATYP